MWVRKVKKRITKPDGEQQVVEVEIEDLSDVTYEQLVAKSNLTEKELEKLRGFIAVEERSKVTQ